MSAVDGSTTWSFPLGGVSTSTPCVDDTAGVVYVASEAGSLFAVSTTQGTAVWTFTCGGQVLGSLRSRVSLRTLSARRVR